MGAVANDLDRLVTRVRELEASQARAAETEDELCRVLDALHQAQVKNRELDGERYRLAQRVEALEAIVESGGVAA